MKYTVEFPLEAVSAADDVELIGRAVDRLGFDAPAITEHPGPLKGLARGSAGTGASRVNGQSGLAAGVH